VNLPGGTDAEAHAGDDDANSKFDQRRMLGVDREVVTLNVGDARDDVVVLVERKNVQAPKRWRNDCRADNQDNETEKHREIGWGHRS
jgi:hypothetical protein